MDISFKNEEDVKFNFRVGGIILGNNKILLQRNRDNPYYALVGGRVHYMESTLEAIKREVLEETGVLIDNKDITLVDVVENFFVHRTGKYHEILFIYKINANNELLNKDNFQTMDSDFLSINKWYNLDELADINLVPKIAKDLIYRDNLNHDVVVESK